MDQVTEDLEKGKGNPGSDANKGMPTPAEIEAAEAAGKEQDAKAKAEAEEQARKDAEAQSELEQVVSIDPKQIEAIEAKVNSGEQLNAEEQAVLDQIDAGLKIMPKAEDIRPPKTYQVGNKSFSEEEAQKEALKAAKLEGIENLPPEALDRLTEQWAKAQNRSVAQVHVAKGQRENAAERAKLEGERLRLDQRKADLKREAERVTKEKARLKALADDPVTEETAASTSEQVRLVRKIEAQEQLEAIEGRTQELSQEEGNLKAETERQIAREFIVNHPEYETSEDFFLVADKIAKGQSVDADDRLKVLEVVDMMDSAIPRGILLEDQWLIASKRNALAVKPLPQGPGGQNSTGLPQAQSLRDKIAEFKKRQRAIIQSGGTGAVPTSPMRANELTAKGLMAVDKQVLGEQKGDAFFEESFKGY